jgi:predicted ATP-grasp superfamily ATP-dependent carboligase
MDMADRHKVSMITCVEGLPTQGSRIQNGLKTHFVTDSDAMFERLLHLDAEPVPTAMIEGPTGGILARAPYHSTNGMSTTMFLPPNAQIGADCSAECVAAVAVTPACSAGFDGRGRQP